MQSKSRYEKSGELRVVHQGPQGYKEKGVHPGGQEIRQGLDWKKVIEYVRLRHLHVIGMEKPGGDSPDRQARRATCRP